MHRFGLRKEATPALPMDQYGIILKDALCLHANVDHTEEKFTGIRDSVNYPTLGRPTKILGVSSHSGTN